MEIVELVTPVILVTRVIKVTQVIQVNLVKQVNLVNVVSLVTLTCPVKLLQLMNPGEHSLAKGTLYLKGPEPGRPGEKSCL